MNIYRSWGPRLYTFFRIRAIIPQQPPLDHTWLPPRSVCPFHRVQRGLDNEKVNERWWWRQQWQSAEVAEVLAKESLNYKTTDGDDRPKNVAGRGGSLDLSRSRAC